MPRRVAVVGGGITGLAAARFLGQEGVAVTVLEAGEQLGGKIQTLEFQGVPVEAGPDTFLARVPWAVDLCRELGLGDELVAPATGAAFLWIGDRLHPLPEGQVLGVPTVLRPLLRSGLVSPLGVARAALDLVLPRTSTAADPSVAAVVGRRMGRQVLDRLVEPLIGGINAGRADALSLAATAPPVAGAAARSRSLLRGLRRRPADPAAGQANPVFLSVAGGLHRLVDRLAEQLDDVRLATAVTAIRPTGGGYALECARGPEVEADAVLLTVPAYVAARMLSELSPAAAGHLAAIRHASVVTATLAYRPPALARPLEGAGMLVPRVEGRLVTACTWSTTKWPALAESGLVLLRASSGRDGDDRVMELPDDEVVRRLHDELAEVLGLGERPVASLVSRWPRGFPQYEVGHQARVEAVEAALASDLPGIRVAGASYRGLGIAACIEQARRAASLVGAAQPVARP